MSIALHYSCRQNCIDLFTQEDPACNKFGCNKHSAVTSRFLCIKIIDSNGKKLRALAYNRQFLLHLLPRYAFNTDERI